MEEFNIKVTKHQLDTKGAKIVVIGVGGAGGNMLDMIAKSEIGCCQYRCTSTKWMLCRY